MKQTQAIAKRKMEDAPVMVCGTILGKEEKMGDESENIEALLIKLLLERQPGVKHKLEVLLWRYGGEAGHGAFAPIKSERCGVCDIEIARVRLRFAKGGMFVPCANCSRFLYCPEALKAEGVRVQSEDS